MEAALGWGPWGSEPRCGRVRTLVPSVALGEKRYSRGCFQCHFGEGAPCTKGRYGGRRPLAPSADLGEGGSVSPGMLPGWGFRLLAPLWERTAPGSQRCSLGRGNPAVGWGSPSAFTGAGPTPSPRGAEASARGSAPSGSGWGLRSGRPSAGEEEARRKQRDAAGPSGACQPAQSAPRDLAPSTRGKGRTLG